MTVSVSLLTPFTVSKSITMVVEADSLRKAGFKGDIIDASSSEFTDASKRFSAIFNAKAKLIAFPGTAEDVSTAVLFAGR